MLPCGVFPLLQPSKTESSIVLESHTLHKSTLNGVWLLPLKQRVYKNCNSVKTKAYGQEKRSSTQPNYAVPKLTSVDKCQWSVKWSGNVTLIAFNHTNTLLFFSNLHSSSLLIICQHFAWLIICTLFWERCVDWGNDVALACWWQELESC